MNMISSIISRARTGELEAVDLIIRITGYPNRRYYNPKLAKEFWRNLKTLSNSNSDAMCLLGEKYLYGSPYGTIPSKGISLIELARQRGSIRALHNIATWHFFGLCGYPKNPDFAIQLLEQDGSENTAALLNLWRQYNEANKTK